MDLVLERNGITTPIGHCYRVSKVTPDPHVICGLLFLGHLLSRLSPFSLNDTIRLMHASQFCPTGMCSQSVEMAIRWLSETGIIDNVLITPDTADRCEIVLVSTSDVCLTRMRPDNPGIFTRTTTPLLLVKYMKPLYEQHVAPTLEKEQNYENA